MASFSGSEKNIQFTWWFTYAFKSFLNQSRRREHFFMSIDDEFVKKNDTDIQHA